MRNTGILYSSTERKPVVLPPPIEWGAAGRSGDRSASEWLLRPRYRR
jgi:hypothetical protein